MNSFTNNMYKDRLFCSIFGKEENKHFLLELYNALNHSMYTNIDDLELTIIENVIYLTMKNDVSFLIGSELNLYEQQSTYNPNMPLRGLMYFAQAYQMYLSRIGKDLYGSALVKIPTPKFIIFYNGNKEIEDKVILKLSDAFENSDKSGNFEWTATMININKNHNSLLLKSCKSLYYYVEYIAMVKEYLKDGLSKENAIKKALNHAIKKNFLDGYFKKAKMEVLNMSLTEFNQEEYDKNRREEAYFEKAIETAKKMITKNFSTEDIMDISGLSLSQIEELQLSVLK